jgi:hypothetical protein
MLGPQMQQLSSQDDSNHQSKQAAESDEQTKDKKEKSGLGRRGSHQEEEKASPTQTSSLDDSNHQSHQVNQDESEDKVETKAQAQVKFIKKNFLIFFCFCIGNIRHLNVRLTQIFLGF